jgi:FtsP/CotA-like multicopper oxidase with cupredoxin domain
VLLSIPAGLGNTYTYDVPKTMPNGLYWYHSHRHTMTAQQTYYSLAGLLEIGRPDGNLPLVSQNHIPVRDMAIQYNDSIQLRVRPERQRPSAEQLQLAAVRQHVQAAGRLTTG